MAAAEVESVVNRWVVDYYLNLALEFLQTGKHEDFCAIKLALDRVLARPVEKTEPMFTKIQVLDFLSLINDGDKLALPVEPDPPVTHLESALMLLESMSQDCSIPHKDFENVCTSIKEMIVGLFIKDRNFDRAKEVLNKHFPKPMVGKKAIFMGLIKQKSRMHKVIEQINFQQFREEMLAFCQRICPLSPTFLQKAAKHLIDERLADQDNSSADAQAEPSPPSSPQVNTAQCGPCKQSLIQRTRLEAAYKALAAGSDGITFSELEEEVDTEENEGEDICLRLSLDPKSGTNLSSEPEGLFQRDSSSPMEASLADHPPQTDAITQALAGSSSQTPTVKRTMQLYTLAKLVSEPDSQNTECSQDLETEVRIETPPQTQAAFNEKDLQCPLIGEEVATPIRKRPRRACSRALTDSEENPSSACDEEIPKTSSSSKRTLDDADETCITDSSVGSSPNALPPTSSTPHKDSAQVKDPATSKWKKLFHDAKESKETWSDEDVHFNSKSNSGLQESSISYSSHRKRMWTDIETQKLKEGVKKFGEGNWSKIKAYYSFKDRTNVNLKDRWRTLKKLNDANS
ncbi:telomeric repeat binding factor a [Parambassis ranga]|uniref:Telomeric repeat binding factor a n=1 Tax=Parambassis ranga TaxID=210632 RepID=A0A6P7I3X4_9TELE|nr:telomeric repeat-binding factor 2-like [Parambassis ranga]